MLRLRQLFCLLPLCFAWAAPAFAHPAYGICVAPDNTVYFSDVERNRVWLVTPKGILKSVLAGKHSHGLFYANDGFLYGEHLAFDATTQRWLHGRWRSRATDLVEEFLPLTADLPRGWGLCHDAAGNLYAIEQNDSFARIIKRTPDGAVSVLAGGAQGHADGQGEQARFTFLEALNLGADGALYVRDNASIRRITLQGVVSTVGGNPLGGEPHPQTQGLMGLAADASGNVYVADMAAHCVRRIHPDNRVETVWQSNWLWTPTGVAVHNNAFYVLENLSPSPILWLARFGIGPYTRVYRVGSDGVAVKLATVWGPTTRTAAGVIVFLLALLSLWRLRKNDQRQGF